MTPSIRLNTLAGALLLALSFSAANAASLTYKGNLQDGGKPANGSYDIRLTLYSNPTGGTAIGSPVTLYAVPVHDGTFSTDVDFGAAANNGNPVWVGAAVAPAGSGNFTALDSRSMASLDAPSGTCDSYWSLSGNSGNPSGSYLGTTDNNSLIFKVDGVQAGALIPHSGGTEVVFGASNNSAGTANSSTVVGGYDNAATGDYATVGGGQENTAAAPESFAAGWAATVRASDVGSFVWCDSVTDPSECTSTGANQFLIQASGGVSIGTNNPNGNQLRVVASTTAIRGEDTSGEHAGVSGYSSDGFGDAGSGVYGQVDGAGGNGVTGYNNGGGIGAGGAGVFGYTNNNNSVGVRAYHQAGGTALYVATSSPSGSTKVIDTSTGAYLSSGGQWEPNSDRNKKFGFAPLDLGSVLDKVLAMPVTSWSYKVEGDSIHHIGPMAQDFYAAFKLGQDDKHIGEVDEGGVAFAAIQGLNQKLEREHNEREHAYKKIADENVALKAQNAALTAKLAQLDARMTSLEVAQHAIPTARYQVAERGE
ncbi:MAG: tail fiber domain-containing protein [Lysobacterales bacterium]